ncbi:MAG: hypothetical protein Kow0097_04470 [Candidatus Bipolaricaulota bacterium]
MILGALFRILGAAIGLVAGLIGTGCALVTGTFLVPLLVGVALLVGGLILLPLFFPVVLILVGAWIAYRILVPTRPR